MDAAVEPPLYGLRSETGLTLMLDLRMRTGDRLALPYAYLVSVTYERSTGLLLQFTSHAVEVTGRNLEPLYEALLAQRIEYLREGDPLHDATPEAATFIEAITVDVVGA